jgi:glucosamine kinase
MILIADSGSTKTDWRLMDKDREITQIKTKGFNPYYQQAEEMFIEIESHLIPKLDASAIDTIYFYGAGCSTTERQKNISEALSSFFKKTEIFVQSDLLGAARALCGNQPGIVGILGTGSGSCQYDGENIRGFVIIFQKYRNICPI